jgi:hypothetical protein
MTRARSFSGESVAGPRVQIILVFRMGCVGFVDPYFARTTAREL